MTAYRGPENGATPGSDLWLNEEPSGPARPMSISESEAQRNGQATGHPSGEGTAHNAPPSVPILPPDDYELMRRLDRLEAAVLNQESVIALAVQVATTAAEAAKAMTDPHLCSLCSARLDAIADGRTAE